MKKLFIKLFVLFAAIAVACSGSLARASTIDTTTQGSWIGTYGANGYILLDYQTPGTAVFSGAALNARDLASLPSYISSYTYGGGAQQFKWDSATADVRALQNPAAPLGLRQIGTSFDGDDYFIDFAVSSPKAFQFAVYGVDWDNFGGGRNIILNVPGDSANLSSYQNGKWAIFNMIFNAPGTFRLDIIDNQPGGNNTISAIAFNSLSATLVPEPSTWATFALIGVAGVVFALTRRKTWARLPVRVKKR